MPFQSFPFTFNLVHWSLHHQLLIMTFDFILGNNRSRKPFIQLLTCNTGNGASQTVRINRWNFVDIWAIFDIILIYRQHFYSLDNLIRKIEMISISVILCDWNIIYLVNKVYFLLIAKLLLSRQFWLLALTDVSVSEPWIWAAHFNGKIHGHLDSLALTVKTDDWATAKLSAKSILCLLMISSVYSIGISVDSKFLLICFCALNTIYH